MTESTKPKPFCFVLMPFDKSFNDTYEFGIVGACKDAGAYCERVDKQIFEERILDRVYNQIAKADIIIADMTGRNPNVFYEVGYAHALGKTVILLTKEVDDIPFDMKHFRHIIYQGEIVNLKKQLFQTIAFFIENPKNKQSISNFDFYIEEHNLSLTTLTIHGPDSWRGVVITYQNNSVKTYGDSDYKIGIVTDKTIDSLNYGELRIEESRLSFERANLPNNQYLHIFPYTNKMFPFEFKSFSFDFKQSKSDEKLIVRLYTEEGTRDFEFNSRVDPNNKVQLS